MRIRVQDTVGVSTSTRVYLDDEFYTTVTAGHTIRRMPVQAHKKTQYIIKIEVTDDSGKTSSDSVTVNYVCPDPTVDTYPPDCLGQ